MPSIADLHIHTTASDGVYTPEQIVRKASEKGLKYIAVTDHDTIEGIEEAIKAAKGSELKVIAGVEVSTDSKHGLAHVLGYFIDYKNKELVEKLREMRHSRQLRAHDMVKKLQGLGLKVEWGRVKEIAGEASIGRPHIAQALLEKGFITSFAEAFHKYIGQGGPAYVERIKITPEEAVRMIKQAGGIAVLAHPFTLDEPEALIKNLKEEGLSGIEVYYGEYSEAEVERLSRIADKYELLKSGGSDYHGLNEETEAPIGGIDMPASEFEKLLSLDKE